MSTRITWKKKTKTKWSGMKERATCRSLGQTIVALVEDGMAEQTKTRYRMDTGKETIQFECGMQREAHGYIPPEEWRPLPYSEVGLTTPPPITRAGYY